MADRIAAVLDALPAALFAVVVVGSCLAAIAAAGALEALVIWTATR